MKHILVMVFWATLLAACADGVRPQAQKSLTSGNDVILDPSVLGDSWCLLDSPNQARGAVREVSLEGWEAHEATSPTTGEFTSCDVGPIRYYVPSSATACKGSPTDNPALGVFADDGRIAIERVGSSDTFKVTFKDISGNPMKGVDSKSAFAAIGNASNNRYKWLRGSVGVQQGTGQSVTYDVYIYLADTSRSATVALQKLYRVEFFRTNGPGCVDEEPDKPNGSSGPFIPAPGICPTPFTAKENIKQAPVGDGHHGLPNAAGSCDY